MLPETLVGLHGGPDPVTGGTYLARVAVTLVGLATVAVGTRVCVGLARGAREAVRPGPRADGDDD